MTATLIKLPQITGSGFPDKAEFLNPVFLPTTNLRLDSIDFHIRLRSPHAPANDPRRRKWRID